MQVFPRFMWLSFVVGIIIILFSACQDPYDNPTPRDITKADREAIGDRISLSIFMNNEDFPILPKIAPYDTTIYWFVQKLYDQATNTMHLDLNSSASNRWNSNRDWNVYIIERDDLRQAFILPGGDFYISTGFLKSMSREYELYYLLAFEAHLMNEKYLLNYFIETYNSRNLLHFSEKKLTGMPLSPAQLAEDVSNVTFSADIVATLDEITVNSICESSVYERTGVIDIVQNEVPAHSDWLIKRENYPSRITNVTEIAVEDEANCGVLRTNGYYQRYVLNLLQ